MAQDQNSGGGQDSQVKAAKMGPEMSKSSDQPTQGGQAKTDDTADILAAEMPERMSESSSQAKSNDGTVTWSEKSTGSDGLPAGTDAASGRGSDGPV